MLDENKLIQNIILGSDYEDVIANIVIDEGMDPLSLDIKKLVDKFVSYLNKMKEFNFRIPARFILVAAILVRMKCDIILSEEEEKAVKESRIPDINLDKIMELQPPIVRKPVRKITLNELISALNKAFEFKQKKESKKIRMKYAVEKLIEPEEDIEMKIKNIFNSILKSGIISFSDLVPVWKRKEIVDAFIPLLYLIQRDKIICEQKEMFKDITIRLK